MKTNVAKEFSDNLVLIFVQKFVTTEKVALPAEMTLPYKKLWVKKIKF